MKKSGTKHPSQALSPAHVRNLKTPGRYADGNGLYLVVDPSGAKRWLLRIVVMGKRRDIGLGGLATVGLAEARQQATKMRGVARDGGDPLEERLSKRRVLPTFEKAAYETHTNLKPSWKNPKHGDQWINTLKQYVFPVMGSKPVNLITSADVLAALTPIWQAKAETARRILQRINAVMHWAKAKGYTAGDNPTEGVRQALPKVKPSRKHHAFLPYEDVPAFLKKLKSSGEPSASKLALEFAILTGARTNEVLGMTWQEVDLRKRLWNVPAARMKPGVDHRVPLSRRCSAILKSARALGNTSPYVFPGEKKGRPLSNMTFLMTLRRMRLKVTGHGFRTSLRVWAAEQTNFPPRVAEAAISHKIKDKAEAAYNRTDLLEKRREMMNLWADYCCGRQRKGKSSAKRGVAKTSH